MPIKNTTGFLKLINLLICANDPTAIIPIILVVITEITANAKVKFKSAAGERKSGICFPSWSIIKDPTPGKMPERLEAIIKIKIVKIN